MNEGKTSGEGYWRVVTYIRTGEGGGLYCRAKERQEMLSLCREMRLGVDGQSLRDDELVIPGCYQIYAGLPHGVTMDYS